MAFLMAVILTMCKITFTLKEPEHNTVYQENHQKDNNRPKRNKDGYGLRRLTRIMNNEF